jgi:hypothetical protein
VDDEQDAKKDQSGWGNSGGAPVKSQRSWWNCVVGASGRLVVFWDDDLRAGAYIVLGRR